MGLLLSGNILYAPGQWPSPKPLTSARLPVFQRKASQHILKAKLLPFLAFTKMVFVTPARQKKSPHDYNIALKDPFLYGLGSSSLGDSRLVSLAVQLCEVPGHGEEASPNKLVSFTGTWTQRSLRLYPKGPSWYPYMGVCGLIVGIWRANKGSR